MRKIMRSRWRIGPGFLLVLACVSPALAEEELRKLTDRLLAPPALQVESGFTASVLVPPGHLYDPLFMVPRGEVVWLNDDGGEEGEKGSRILAIAQGGKISTLAGLGKLLPVTGFDVAPPSFGQFGGQIFTLAQGKVGMEGATANHVIQRVDPQKDYAATIVCTVPTAGAVNKGIGGFGVDARFGPEGSPFAGKFFAATAYNNTIYQVTADGKCSPFVTFDPERLGAPFGLVFSPDGKTMLVTVARGDLLGPAAGRVGAVVQVSPDGKVADKPLVQELTSPTGMAFAPAGFGAYAGQLFIADAGSLQAPVPMTQALTTDGKLYRASPDGKPQLVASGFFNPVGVHFVNNTLWVSDINGDFIAGRRELPDGFMVEIRAQ